MIKDVNVMVFPCGTEVGLEIHKSLKNTRFVTLYGSSTAPGHGEYVYKNHCEYLPKLDDPAFIDEFAELLVKKKIDLVFPTIEEAIVRLSENRDRFQAQILAPSEKAVKICRDKSLTYLELAGSSYLPEVYADADAVNEYPVLVKPACGQASQGVRIIHNKGNLIDHLKTSDVRNVICEYLPGDEYTVDCFTDREKNLKYIGMRKRSRTKGGICMTSVAVEADESLCQIAEDISNKLDLRGEWFFQVKRDKHGKCKLMEVATRCAGTMCVNRALNVNLPLLTVLDAIGESTTIESIKGEVTVDRALYNSFRTDLVFDEVYIDYDDTLVIHDRVNHEAIRFLYQCAERDIPVILITKHHKDIREELLARCISPALFRDIVHITSEDKKVEHVSPTRFALFIDDSFREREEMRKEHGITAIGPESIETLIDWKE